jgi:membrane protein CcdC involved in cytochrome C biogenesis
VALARRALRAMSTTVIITSLIGAALIIVWRLRETSRPITARRIVIPPLGMSTGLAMFAFPPARIPLSWALGAFALGVLVFAYPLVKSSRLTRRGDQILLERSKAFMWILLGLVAVRLFARSYVERHVNTLQTGSIFFLLAFGMIVRWRVQMFMRYRELVTAPASPVTADAGGPSG